MALTEENLKLVRSSRKILLDVVTSIVKTTEMSQAEGRALAKESGFTVQTIADIIDANRAQTPKFTIERVIQCLEQIRDGEVTHFKDIGTALGFKNYFHQVAGLLSEAEGIAALAAPVIIAESNAKDFKSPRKFRVGGEKVNRDAYLDLRGVEYSVQNKEMLYIPKSQYVSAETLRQRLAALDS